MLRIFTALLTVFTLIFSAHAQPLSSAVQKALQSISGLEAYQHVKQMAGDEFSGRLTGSPGYTAAAKWAAGLFKSWGLKPAAPNYLQPFPAPYTQVDSARLTVKIGQKEWVLQPGKDFLPLLFTDSGEVEAELVFVGWGVFAPELHYDDYADLDVNGKIVVCFRGIPDGRNPDFRPHDAHRRRMQVARDKGAVGLFYIYDNPIANPNGDWLDGFLPAVISKAVADSLLAFKNVSADDLRRDLQTYQRPISFALPASVHYKVSAHTHPDARGLNVVGYVEGSDPVLKKECLVVGAHFDHCGRHAGLLFPGANDNASGSAAVLEIGRAFAKLQKKPKRSVVFVLFGGEEMGLKGSAYFTDHLPPQFEKVTAMFNFDMIGEGDGLSCGYSPEPPELLAAIEQADAVVNSLRRKRAIRGSGGGSDYASFVAKGIPAASVASNGPHLFYHRSGDTIYRINPDILEDASKLVFLAVYDLANSRK